MGSSGGPDTAINIGYYEKRIRTSSNLFYAILHFLILCLKRNRIYRILKQEKKNEKPEILGFSLRARYIPAPRFTHFNQIEMALHTGNGST